MQPYKKLAVWRKSHELTLRLYAATVPFHALGQHALASQLRRAAHSIPSSIAEGSGRSTSAQFANALQVAIGSARALDYHLLLTRDLGLLTASDHATLEARTDEIRKMLVALRRTVATQAPRASTAKSAKTRVAG